MIEENVFAINTAVYESTKYSPFEVMYGRKAKIPVQIKSNDGDTDDKERQQTGKKEPSPCKKQTRDTVNKERQQTGKKEPSPCKKQTRDTVNKERQQTGKKEPSPAGESVFDGDKDDKGKQQTTEEDPSPCKKQKRDTVNEEVYRNIKNAQEKQKKNYDRKFTGNINLCPGSVVFLRNFRRTTRLGDKTKPFWVGPYEVMKVLDKGRVQLKNLKSGQILKPLHDASNLKVKQQDEKESHQSSGQELPTKNDGKSKPETEATQNKRKFSNESKTRQKNKTQARHGYSDHRIHFRPVDWYWQETVADILNLHVQKKHYVHDVPNISVHATPQDKIRIIGDRNCFYRSLSCLIVGTEDEHTLLRRLMATHVQDNDDKYYQITNQKDYVRTSHMDTPKIFSTEVDIFAAATMFNTDIYVYTSHDRAVTAWLRYQPLHNVPQLFQRSDRGLFIRNMHDHFTPVFKV